MEKRVFLSRSITIESRDGNISVHRSRNNHHFCEITITKALDGFSLSFPNRRANTPDHSPLPYESSARELGEMILKICDDPCPLPEEE